MAGKTRWHRRLKALASSQMMGICRGFFDGKGVKYMKNMHEIAGNIAIIGGLLTTTGSIVDGVVHRDQIEREATKTHQLAQQYGLTEECSTGVFSPSTTICFYKVPYAYSQAEEEKVLSAFGADLKAAGIGDPPRVALDGSLAMTGMFIATAGVITKSDRRNG